MSLETNLEVENWYLQFKNNDLMKENKNYKETIDFLSKECDTLRKKNQCYATQFKEIFNHQKPTSNKDFFEVFFASFKKLDEIVRPSPNEGKKLEKINSNIQIISKFLEGESATLAITLMKSFNKIKALYEQKKNALGDFHMVLDILKKEAAKEKIAKESTTPESMEILKDIIKTLDNEHNRDIYQEMINNRQFVEMKSQEKEKEIAQKEVKKLQKEISEIKQKLIQTQNENANFVKDNAILKQNIEDLKKKLVAYFANFQGLKKMLLNIGDSYDLVPKEKNLISGQPDFGDLYIEEKWKNDDLQNQVDELKIKKEPFIDLETYSRQQSKLSEGVNFNKKSSKFNDLSSSNSNVRRSEKPIPNKMNQSKKIKKFEEENQKEDDHSFNSSSPQTFCKEDENTNIHEEKIEIEAFSRENENKNSDEEKLGKLLGNDEKDDVKNWNRESSPEERIISDKEEEKKGEKVVQKDEKKQLTKEEEIIGKLYGEIDHHPDLLDTIPINKKKVIKQKIVKKKKSDDGSDISPEGRVFDKGDENSNNNENSKEKLAKLLYGYENDVEIPPEGREQGEKKEESKDKKPLSREEEIVGKLIGEIEHNPDMLDTAKVKRRIEKPKVEEKKESENGSDFYEKSVEYKYIDDSDASGQENIRTDEKQEKKTQEEEKPLFISKMQQIEVVKSSDENEFEAYKKDLRAQTDKLKTKIVEKMLVLKLFLKGKKKGYSPVSPFRSLSFFANEYKNPKIIEKILEIKESIPMYRQIKGDGNCFFRAVGLCFIEILFLEKINIEKIKYSMIHLSLENMFKTVNMIDFKSESKDPEIDAFFEKDKNLLLEIFLLKMQDFFLLKLELAKEDNKFENNLLVTKAIENELNDNLAFDLALICVIRSMLFNSYCDLKDDPDYKDVLFDYEQQKINLQTYGQEAENFMVPFTAQALFLKMNIYMLHVDNKKNEETFLLEEYGPKDDPDAKTINLFFRPGHFDIGYSAEFLKESYGSIEEL